MAKILILAPSGFGKSTSIGAIPQFNHKGLDPKETYIITCTSKPLPFKGSGAMYPITTFDNLKGGQRVISNKGDQVGHVIENLSKSPFKNIVVDDSNYIMQDYYMANAKTKGYDVFKNIGIMMDKIFAAAELLHDKNFIMMAHYEEYKSASGDEISYRFKTVGKMVQDYITPEGKFDIVLFGRQTYDVETGVAKKEFVTNYDGQFPAKSPVGMFEDLYIPNDLGYVTDKVKEYYS